MNNTNTNTVAVDVNVLDPLPENRVEISGSQAWIHITASEAEALRRAMSASRLPASECDGTGDGTGVMLDDIHWSVASDAAWTCIVDGEADVLCQILDDGRVEHVQVHPD